MKRKIGDTEYEYDFDKSVHWSIKSINNLKSEIAFKTKREGFPINDTIATSIKNPDGGFTIKFFLDEFFYDSGSKSDKYGVTGNILLKKGEMTYSINEKSVTSLNLLFSVPQVITITVKNFQSAENKEFDGKVQRLIIPVENEVQFDVFNCKSIHISGTIVGCGLIEVKVGNKTYHLFKYSNRDTKTNYLIIDSLEENTFNEFKKNTSSILLGFGFVTGNLYQNEYYYQIIREDNITLADATAYVKKEASISSNVSLFNPLYFKKVAAKISKEKGIKIPTLLSSESFSRICNKLNKNETFARCIKLILEGNQTKLLLLRAGIHSIALETLTNIIYEENEDSINPIPDKQLAKKIRKKLKSELNEYEAFLSEYGHSILNAKLDNLNRPTNSKKLSKPFEIYNIPLSKSDLEILNHRNKFLHGTSPFNEDELQNKENEIKHISSKLLYLIYCLALKYCGYRGHIVNFASVRQLNLGEKMTEPLFTIL